MYDLFTPVSYFTSDCFTFDTTVTYISSRDANLRFQKIAQNSLEMQKPNTLTSILDLHDGQAY